MPSSPKPKKAKAAKKAAARKSGEGERDPWVELQRGLIRDVPLPLSGQIVEVQVLPPGTRMLRSQAVELGITDYVEVDGPPAVPGFQTVLTPTGSGPGDFTGGPGLGTEGMRFRG